jgi:hypothetical protein
MIYPVWRYRAIGDGIIVHDAEMDKAAKLGGFVPADELGKEVTEEEQDPIPDVEIEEPAPKRRGRPRKT